MCQFPKGSIMTPQTSVRLKVKGCPKIVRPCAAMAVSHMYSNSDFDNRIENEATSHFNIEKLS